jgi:hypothetical protein
MGGAKTNHPHTRGMQKGMQTGAGGLGHLQGAAEKTEPRGARADARAGKDVRKPEGASSTTRRPRKD